MTPAAPPCITLFRLQYAGVISSEKVADARIEGAGACSSTAGLSVLGGPREASSSTASPIKRLSNPLKSCLATMSQYLDKIQSHDRPQFRLQVLAAYRSKMAFTAANALSLAGAVAILGQIITSDTICRCP